MPTPEDNENALKLLGQWKVHTHIGYERAHTQEQAEAKLIGLKAQLPHAAREQPEAFWIEEPNPIPPPTHDDPPHQITVTYPPGAAQMSAGTHHPNPVEQAQIAALMGVAQAMEEGVEDPEVKPLYKPGLKLAASILTKTAEAITQGTVIETPEGDNDE